MRRKTFDCPHRDMFTIEISSKNIPVFIKNNFLLIQKKYIFRRLQLLVYPSKSNISFLAKTHFLI